MKVFLLFLAVFAGSSLSGCQLCRTCLSRATGTPVVQLVQTEPEKKTPPPLYAWTDETAEGTPAIRISLADQKAVIYRGEKVAGWTTVATGVASHPTPTGTFRIMEKQRHKRSNRYGVIVNASGRVIDGDAKAGRERVPRGGRFVGASMPYWMRLTGAGVGMHAGPIPRPGSPASHGCIRLPSPVAEKLFACAPVGTRVTILRAIDLPPSAEPPPAPPELASRRVTVRRAQVITRRAE